MTSGTTRTSKDSSGTTVGLDSVPIPVRRRARQDTDRFHAALEKRGYSLLDHEPDRRRREPRPHYDRRVCSQDHYSRIRILVFRGAVVRLYPHDDYVPTTDELAAVIDALEVGFDARSSTIQSRGTTMTDLQAAYDRTDFKIVQPSPNLEIPVSTPVMFATTDEIDPVQFENILIRREYAFIAPHYRRTSLESKVYDAKTNEFFRVKVYARSIQIYPMSEEFSFETFERVVTTIEAELTELELMEDDE